MKKETLYAQRVELVFEYIFFREYSAPSIFFFYTRIRAFTVYRYITYEARVIITIIIFSIAL